MMRNRSTRGFAAALFLAAGANLAHAADWLQFGYDAAHSGFNRAERGYPTYNGNRVAYHYALPTAIDTAPVYLAGVATPSGTRNLLFAVAKNGTLYALDANTPTLTIVWSKNPGGTGLSTGGSAAIDPSRQYVYAYALDGKVHKYHVADGVEVTGSGWPQVSTLKPEEEKGASSLSIAAAQDGHTYLYSVTSAAYSDDGNDYQGHVTAIDLGSGAQRVFNAQCSDLTAHFIAWGITSGIGQNDCQRIGGGNSGIWGRAGAVYDAGTGRLFITTGNGLFDPSGAVGYGRFWGDSILALHADGSGDAVSGLPLDSYTPTTYGSDNPKVGLQGYDADLGANSLAIVPAPPGSGAGYQHIAVQAGKDGCVRLVNLSNLSGQSQPGHVGGQMQQVDFPGGSNCATGQDGPEIKMQPAVWVDPRDQSSWVFIATEYNGSAAYRLSVSSGKPALPVAPTWYGHAGTSPVVANGIVYLMSDTRLYAYDAATGAPAVADNSAWGTAVINDSHWQSPIVVDGRVYLFDGWGAAAAQLWVYELDGAFKNGFD